MVLEKIFHFQLCQVWKSIWYTGCKVRYTYMERGATIYKWLQLRGSHEALVSSVYSMCFENYCFFSAALPWPQYKECNVTMTQKRHTLGQKLSTNFMCLIKYIQIPRYLTVLSWCQAIKPKNFGSLQNRLLNFSLAYLPVGNHCAWPIYFGAPCISDFIT